MNPASGWKATGRVPFTILEGVLVVAAFALSGAAVRGVLAIRNPPPMSPGFMLSLVVIAAFAGPFLLGPLIQVEQAIRLGRRRWTPVEWAWSGFGVGYALFTAAGWSFDVPDWMPDWLARGVFPSVFLGPGPIALVCALPGLVRGRGRGLPWSGWFGLVTAILWSGIGFFLDLAR